MTTPLRLALLGGTAALMALGFGLNGHPWLASIAGFLGAAWLALEAPLKKPDAGQGERRLPHAGGWAASTGLVVFCGLAAVGVFVGLPGWLTLLVLGLALSAWDLARLERRLQGALDPTVVKRIERRHFARLGWVLAIGWGLGALALSIRVSLGFVPALALGLLVLIALSLAAREVRKG